METIRIFLMIRVLYANELERFPLLNQTMFRDRALQFSDRLGWDVTVDENGQERDEYDELNPLYIIACKKDGTHAGSMRILPTVGKTMINDHFVHLTDGVEIVSPFIWEITRFCIAPIAPRITAVQLMAVGGILMKHIGISNYVAVFDSSMERVYRWIGSSPTVLGRTSLAGAEIGVGLWAYNERRCSQLAAKAKIDEDFELFTTFASTTRQHSFT